MAAVVTLLDFQDSGTSDPAVDAVLYFVRRRIEVAGHTVVPVRLPPSRSRGSADPSVAAAIGTVRAADAVVVPNGSRTTEVTGLDEALAAKTVLTLSLGDGAVAEQRVTLFEDGGLVLDPAVAVEITDEVDDFLARLDGEPVAHRGTGSGRVSPEAGAPDLDVDLVGPHDPRLRPLLEELKVEYSTRYANLGPYAMLTEVPPSDFELPHGTFVLLSERGEPVAGGALRRYDAQTAEVKRVWTSLRHRQRGLALRLMAELERVARELGYTRIHLTTGGRQPEARRLYLSAGYVPRFDTALEPAVVGTHAFGKELVPGAGFVEWPVTS